MGMPSRSLRAGLAAASTALLAAAGASSAAAPAVLWRIPVPLGAPPATATLDRTATRPVATLTLPSSTATGSS